MPPRRCGRSAISGASTLPEDELFDLAASLGADVPMCLAGRTALVSGIGERLQAAPALPAASILLVNPGIALPTREVFEARRGAFSTPAPVTRPWQDLSSFVAALAERGNDLSEAAISLRPEIAEVLAFLRRSDGVRYAAMSGSGATCFALYDSADAARRASASMPAGLVASRRDVHRLTVKAAPCASSWRACPSTLRTTPGWVRRSARGLRYARTR